MSVKNNITVKCDICGKEWTFDRNEHSEKVWRRMVWVRLTTAGRDKPFLMASDLDVCDECMQRQTVLEGDADGGVEIRNVRNVRFSPVIERERRFLDAVDDMPEEGGSL